MVGRIICAIWVLFIALYTGAATANIAADLLDDQSKPTSSAGTVAVNPDNYQRYTLEYKRRQFKQVDGQYFICNGKYLSYDNMKCKPDNGVDKYEAEKPLDSVVKLTYGADAKIIDVKEENSDLTGKMLYVTVTAPFKSTARFVDMRERNISFPPGGWKKVGDIYLTCGENTSLLIDGQFACYADRGFLDYLIGRIKYEGPLNLQHSLERRFKWPVKVLNVSESNEYLNISFQQTSEQAVTHTPPQLGNNNNIVFFPDALSTLLAGVLLVVVIGCCIIAIGNTSYRNLAFAVGMLAASTVPFGVSISTLVLACFLFIAFIYIQDMKSGRIASAEPSSISNRSQAASYSALVRPSDLPSLNEIRETSEATVRPTNTGNSPALKPPTTLDKPPGGPIRKLSLD